MITLQHFYENYLLHHHRTKAVLLQKLLADPEYLPPDQIASEYYGFNREQYELSLRIEARSNLFHAIETLFTLYFCLLPDKNGITRDDQLFFLISKKDHYKKQIREIAADANQLNILDTPLLFSGRETTLGQHIFYYGLKKQEQFNVHESIEAIKTALHILATEISDTSEYNSYKHSLKAISFVKEFAFANRSTREILMKLDASNSMTYFQTSKDDESLFITKVLDTKRDIALTEMASNLIYHIIGFRRAVVCDTGKKLVVGEFNKESVMQCAIRNTELTHFHISQKPIKTPTNPEKE